VTRHVLRYSAALAFDDAWRLTVVDDGVGPPGPSAPKNGIECRILIGRVRYDAKIRLRWRILVKGEVTFVAPADTDLTLWITQPARIADGLVYRELQLERAPRSAAEVMSDW